MPARIVQKTGDEGAIPLSPVGVKITGADQDEWPFGRRLRQFARKEGLPKPMLILAAAAITVLGAIKAGRGGVEGQKTKPAARSDPGPNHPVACGGKTMKGQSLVGKERLAFWGFGKIGAGKIAPEKRREIGSYLQFIARQQRHAAFAREAPISISVARPMGAAIPVKIDAALPAGIGAQSEKVGIGPTFGDQAIKGGESEVFSIEIKPLEQEDICIRRANDCGGAGYIGGGRMRQNVPQKKARTGAGKIRVKDGDAEFFTVLGPGSRRQER